MEQQQERTVIRAVDGYEKIIGITLALRDEFPVFDFDAFAARAVAAAQRYTVCCVGMVQLLPSSPPPQSTQQASTPPNEAAQYFWVRVPAEYWALAPGNGFVAREPWYEDSAIDRNEGMADAIAYDGTPLVRVRVATSPDGRRCRVRVLASHSIADGRTVGSVFDIFRACVPGEPPCLLADCPLCPYGQRANFADGVLAAPKRRWAAVEKRQVLPLLSEAQVAAGQYIEERWSTPWPPLRRYLEACGGAASLQGVLMTVVARTIRQYAGLGDAHPVAVWVPADMRCSPLATAAHRARAFFCGNSGTFPMVHRQDSIDEDIAHCTAQIRAAVADADGPALMCAQAIAADGTAAAEEAQRLLVGFPSLSHHCMGISSNIGVYAHMRRPRLQMSAPLLSDYTATLYTYRGEHSDDTQVMLFRPDVLDPRFVDTLKSQFSTIIAHITK